MEDDPTPLDEIQAQHDTMASRNLGANILLATGAVATAVGVIWLLTAEAGEAAQSGPKPSLRLTW